MMVVVFGVPVYIYWSFSHRISERWLHGWYQYLLKFPTGLVRDGCMVVVEYLSSLRDEIATEHPESTPIITPVMTILAPPLTHSSIREMSEPLSVSEVPTSLAWYITVIGESDPESQANDGLVMVSLVIPHSVQDTVSWSSTARVISSNFTPAWDVALTMTPWL